MLARENSPKDFARKLRQKDNDAEAALWAELRDRRLNNYKFVREIPRGRYFADFACRRKRLVVEVDGSQHIGSEHDVKRDNWLNNQRWSVLRFDNALVLKEREIVLSTIVEVLEKRYWEPREKFDWTFRPALGGQVLMQNCPSNWSASSGLRPPSPPRGDGEKRLV